MYVLIVNVINFYNNLCTFKVNGCMNIVSIKTKPVLYYLGVLFHFE